MDYMRSVLFQRIHRVSLLENAGVGTSIEVHVQATVTREEKLSEGR